MKISEILLTTDWRTILQSVDDLTISNWRLLRIFNSIGVCTYQTIFWKTHLCNRIAEHLKFANKCLLRPINQFMYDYKSLIGGRNILQYRRSFFLWYKRKKIRSKEQERLKNRTKVFSSTKKRDVISIKGRTYVE